MYRELVDNIVEYSRALFGYNRRAFCALVALTSALGVFEGINIVLIAPILSELGLGQESGVSRWIRSAFSFFGLPCNLYTVVLCYVVVMAAQSFLQRRQTVESTKLQRVFGRRLSDDLFEAVTAARWEFWLRNRKSDVTHYLTDEASRVTTGTTFFIQIASAIIIALAQIALAFFVSPVLTALAAVSGITLYFAGQGIIRRSKNLGWQLSEVYRRFHADCHDYLNGIKEIKAYNNEHEVAAEFSRIGYAVDDKIIHFTKAQSNAQLISKLTSSVMLVVFMLLAVKVAKINSEYLLVMLYIFSRLWPRFAVIQNNLHYVIMMLPSFVSMRAFTQKAHNYRETNAKSSERIRAVREGVVIENVDFSYNPERVTLSNVCIEIKANTTVALVGESGSGKSTIADMLIGLHRPDSGLIRIDSRRLDENFLPTWRNSIAYVAQDAFLLNDSIRSNLLWAKPQATDEDLERCLRQAHAWSFIDTLPDKLDSVIGDRGVKLSGGERQRLVLARALLREPAFLLLDEATSALDNDNEHKIKSSLDELRGKLTVFVIAHRLTTIEHADLVVVLAGGQVVETGSYQALIADSNSKLYRLANPNLTVGSLHA